MKLSDLVPPSDLLEKIEGLEAGLRQRRKLSRFGLLGGVLAALLSFVEILPQLAGWLPFGQLEPGWWMLVPAAGGLLFFLYFWSRYWLKEASHPIRYSCSLGSSPVIWCPWMSNRKSQPR
jgi:sterol desaturase/sphingolipid hydroxylase (fatty acid hydroxylase superfamily)